MLTLGGKLLEDAAKFKAEAKMHRDSIKELGDSIDAELAPNVIEFENKTIELSGNAKQQFIEWRNFLNEDISEKNIFTYIQGLQEIISNLKPRTMTEKRRLQIAKTHLREVKRFARRMENEMSVLQEKLNILEESKGDE